jgi:ADP-heptose:LPS heptosyltransferase
VSSILILRYDKIGDMIVTLPILRGLKAANPKLRIGVLASPSNVELLATESAVDESYVLGPGLWNILKSLWAMRNQHYEVVLNFIFNRTTTGALIANLVGRTSIKVGQGEPKYHFYFNKVVSLKRNSTSMTGVLESFVNQAFSAPVSLDRVPLTINIPASNQRVVEGFLDRHAIGTDHFIVLNLSVGESARKLSKEQYRSIVRHVCGQYEFKIVLLALPFDLVLAQQLMHEANRCILFPDSAKATLTEIAALVERARAVISPDTSIVHFAAAMDTSVLAIYASEKVDEEWKPPRVHSESVCSEQGRPASAIPIEQIIASIDRLLRTERKK